MAVLSIYLSGVSTTGIELATEAARQAFGECNVEELNKENLRFKIRTGSKDASVVLIVLDDTSVAVYSIQTSSTIIKTIRIL